MCPKLQTYSRAETTTYTSLNLYVQSSANRAFKDAFVFLVLFWKAMDLLKSLLYLPDPYRYLAYPRLSKLTLEMTRQKTCSLNCFILETGTAEFMYLDGNFSKQ